MQSKCKLNYKQTQRKQKNMKKEHNSKKKKTMLFKKLCSKKDTQKYYKIWTTKKYRDYQGEEKLYIKINMYNKLTNDRWTTVGTLQIR